MQMRPQGSSEIFRDNNHIEVVGIRIVERLDKTQEIVGLMYTGDKLGRKLSKEIQG